MKKEKNKSEPSIPSPAIPASEPWRPTWRWHLKALGGIYLFLVLFYFAVDRWLSRLPEPYRLRDVPVEMTPWLKK
ncbi:MAG: hypothetical protein IPP35_10635 [Elusimicrobia bacterium]|nr:hypothetical protein [Elusimicrobiota bacterium]